MTRDEIAAELERLAPFHHNVALPGGLSTHLPEKAVRRGDATRLQRLVAHTFPALSAACGGSLAGLRVLDVGCNCGGFSVAAAEAGAAEVVGLDVVPRYLEQARFIAAARGLDDRLSFHRLAIEQVDPALALPCGATLGRFDVTLCYGLLYHLEAPVPALRRLAAVTRRCLLVDTAVEPGDGSLWRMEFVTQSRPDSPAITTSLWRDEVSCQFTPTPRAVEELLAFAGFPAVERLTPEHPELGSSYREGRRISFLARRPDALTERE